MRPFLTVWFAWLLVMAGANLATALYARYAAEFHFSSLVLTTIFATYAVVLVPALVLFGRLSDRLGRRVVVVLGLATAVAGLAVFAAARSDLWLYGARALQGLAVGMISGAATAALVDSTRRTTVAGPRSSRGWRSPEGVQQGRCSPACWCSGRLLPAGCRTSWCSR